MHQNAVSTSIVALDGVKLALHLVAVQCLLHHLTILAQSLHNIPPIR